MEEPVGINSLPNELLGNIFQYLDASPPANHLQLSPTEFLECRGPQPLKEVALVCERWRGVANTRLFRRLVWCVDKPYLERLECTPDRQAAMPPLHFVRKHGLASSVEALTIVVADCLSRPSGSSDCFLSDFAPEKHLTYDTDMNWLWATLLEDIDPLRFTLVASPRTLAWLFSRMVVLANDWCFNASQHIVSISRNNRGHPASLASALQEVSDSGSDSTSTNSSLLSHSSISSYLSRRSMRRTPCNLFTMRPWTSLLLNEGSNSEVYRLYEYSMKRPPSILGALLGCEEYPNNSPLIPHSVRDMSYICSLPTPSHWNVIIRFLPQLDRFFFRVSGPDSWDLSRLGSSPEPMEARIRRTDLYISLMRAAFGKRRANGNSSLNWRYLQEIESGDTSNEHAMHMMETTLVGQRKRQGWDLSRPGFFARDEAMSIAIPGGNDGESDSESD